MPGGVSSPVRRIDPYPFFVKEARGSHVWDVDGHRYIDYCMGYGPLLLGHGFPEPIKREIVAQLDRGILYGMPTEIEVKFAEFIVERVPGIAMVRFVNSGTEATMGAIRAARGFTGRNKIIKIDGGFHGAHEAVLVKAGSGAIGIPASKGVPKNFIEHTIQVPFNHLTAMEAAIETYRDDLAAVIMEPVMGNVGVILPKPSYLEGVRKLTEEHGLLLIFDEVITGFRIGMSGAQGYYGVTPDLTVLGKVAGGGFPFGIFGGRREIMETIAPAGETYEAGTFNGNPIALIAGYHTLKYIEENRIHEQIDTLGKQLRESLNQILKDTGCSVTGIGSMFQVFFTDGERPPQDYQEALGCDAERWKQVLWKGMLDRGIFLPPSQYESQFISAAHTEEDIATTIEAYQRCF
ncbi:MAG: glutamate-1-semialdehyde 2,1-aminomutase [Candidatus Bipolaricaulia bacterium]